MALLDKVLNTDIVFQTKNIEEISSHFDKNNRLLFITGRAGTGKSTLLKQLCNTTKKKYVILAPTGIAAVNVGGETIHSFFRFKPGIIYEEAKRSGDRSDNDIYQKLELLIIDEISMVRADLLDCIDIFLRRARKNEEPFGGVQVVVFGDLYQLEPIVRAEEKEYLYNMYDSPYFFSSTVFNELLSKDIQQIEFIELSIVYRQKDKEFINLLDKIRKKQISDDELEVINNRYREGVSDTLPEYIYLTTTNAAAAGINAKNLEILPGEEHIFLGEIEGQVPENNLPTDWEIKLKLNARIILLNNDPDKRWINGTLGYISKIEKDKVYVQIDNGEEYLITPYIWSYYKYYFDKKNNKIEKDLKGSFTQYPIKLAWAITIHKSQGQTFDNTVIWLEGRAFANGQVYVALSRCRTLEGVLLNRPIRLFDIMTDDKVRKFLIQIRKYISNWRFPLDIKQQLLVKAIKDEKRLIIEYLTLDEDIKELTIEPMKLDKVENDIVLSCIENSASLRTLRVEQILSIKEKEYKALN